MSSRIAQMVAVDVLFTAVAHLDYDRAAASLEKSRESCRPHRVDGHVSAAVLSRPDGVQTDAFVRRL